MSRISIYILLILTYLGLSTSFSPNQERTKYFVNEQVFGNYFTGAPVTLILEDAFQSGFLIKTYYQRYKLINVFKRDQTVIASTSHNFWKKNLDNLGMSLFYRDEKSQLESTTPLPAGSLFIGDLSYGHWEYEPSGKKLWYFHRTYRHFPQLFGWGDFVPDEDFYHHLKIADQNGTPFYGLNNEFGTSGTILKNSDVEKQSINNNLWGLLKKHLFNFIGFHGKIKREILWQN